MEELLPHINELVIQLADADYEGIVNGGHGGRLTADEIEQAILDYPGRLTATDTLADDLNVVLHEGRPKSGIVEYGLFFDGKKSDLTLTCEFDLARDPVLTIENIHVL